MTATLHHPMWYRVAGLRPRLRAHAQFFRHHYRGRPWYVLQDRTSTRHYRLSAGAHELIGLLDGKRTVQEVWDALGTRLGDDAPTQHDVIRLLSRLHAADILLSDVSPDAGEILARSQQDRRRKWQQRLMRPLALRFALLDPERLLSRALPIVRPFLGPLGLLAWLVVMVVALVLVTAHWPALTAHWSARALDPRNLLLLWLTYPLVKALHELGHAFAVKAWGGRYMRWA